MILTRNAILKEVEKKNIIIKPFKKSNIGPASIDLTLDNKFRIFRNNIKIKLNENSDYRKYTKLIKTKSIVLEPNEYALGITKERIKLPSNICGNITGRSRYARFGLSIHVTASYIQPGINNKQVLEIKNVSPFSIVLSQGLKICQLVLERTEGNAVYRGKFKNQKDL
ncbi:dCTP deaminase [Candidatus Woesearchaeota archaeon]|nr:dCTP deaminase [Candidatus Woesearchaeota archaeon]